MTQEHSLSEDLLNAQLAVVALKSRVVASKDTLLQLREHEMSELAQEKEKLAKEVKKVKKECATANEQAASAHQELKKGATSNKFAAKGSNWRNNFSASSEVDSLNAELERMDALVEGQKDEFCRLQEDRDIAVDQLEQLQATLINVPASPRVVQYSEGCVVS